MEWLLLIIGGGIAVPTAVFLVARHLVHQHGDPAKGEAYLKAHRERKAAEHDEAVRAELARVRQQTRPSRQKELTR